MVLVLVVMAVVAAVRRSGGTGAAVGGGARCPVTAAPSARAVAVWAVACAVWRLMSCLSSPSVRLCTSVRDR